MCGGEIHLTFNKYRNGVIYSNPALIESGFVFLKSIYLFILTNEMDLKRIKQNLSGIVTR